MTTSALRKQLRDYMEVAADKKIKAIYTILENEIKAHKSAGNHWDDPEFIAEMNRRATDMETGVDKGRSWEEVKSEVRRKSVGLEEDAKLGAMMNAEKTGKAVSRKSTLKHLDA